MKKTSIFSNDFLETNSYNNKETKNLGTSKSLHTLRIKTFEKIIEEKEKEIQKEKIRAEEILKTNKDFIQKEKEKMS